MHNAANESNQFEKSKKRRGRTVNIAVHADHIGPRYVAWLDLGSATPTRCYVENVSQSGAKLKVFGDRVPDEFTLHFNRKGDAKVRCRVTAMAGSKCDVEFVTSLAMYATSAAA
jgi:hypothetical protein